MPTTLFKNLAILIFIWSQSIFAQVGIGTTNPQQKLHIAGNSSTIRIDGLNNSNNPNINNGIDLAPIAVNSDGDLVLGGSPFLSAIILDEDDNSFINPTVYIKTNTGALASGSLDNKTITLTQETLVEVNYNISCGIDNGAGTTPATSGALVDGMNRTIGAAVFINGSLEGANAFPFTNSDAPTNWNGTTTYSSGYFTITGSVYKILPAGTHTIGISGYVIGIENDSGKAGKVGAEFGAGYSRIIIIKHN